jgi:hypothetical protein
MNFDGAIRHIDVIDPSLLSSLKEQINSEFGDKWIRRTLNLMLDSYCLKAITPSQIDILAPQDAERLRELLVPVVTPYVRLDETLVYLDISCLPAGAECVAHFDHALMHVLSRRIHIPVCTNSRANFALLTRDGLKNHHLTVGNVYEVNNEIIHAVGNYGETDRWHIIIDVMDTVIYKRLLEIGRLFSIAVDGSVNFSIDPIVVSKLQEKLRGPALDI